MSGIIAKPARGLLHVQSSESYTYSRTGLCRAMKIGTMCSPPYTMSCPVVGLAHPPDKLMRLGKRVWPVSNSLGPLSLDVFGGTSIYRNLSHNSTRVKLMIPTKMSWF